MRRPHAEQGVRHDEIATKDRKTKDHLCSVDHSLANRLKAKKHIMDS